jgi:hypothetical protein
MGTIAKWALAAAVAVAAVPAGAQRESWTFLGHREIDGGRQQQVFRVESGRRFSVVRLCVTRQAVHFREVNVHFREGGQQNFRLGFVLPNFRCTADINLRGGDRDLSELVLTYGASGIRRRGARVRMDAR